MIAAGWFEPKVVYGYFGAQGDGNDVIVYNLPEGWKQGDPVPAETLRFTFPRQREGRGLCISDFFLSKSSGKMDVLGMSCVTIGSIASHETQKLFEGGEYTKYLYLHGLSVETAEALAEFSHKRFARSWALPPRTRRTRAICSIRSIAAQGIRSGIQRARTWRIRPSCSSCCIPMRPSA